MPLKTIYDKENSLYSKSLYNKKFHPEAIVKAVERSHGLDGINSLLNCCKKRLDNPDSDRETEQDALLTSERNRRHDVSISRR